MLKCSFSVVPFSLVYSSNSISLLGVLERVFCIIGEYALHVGCILLVVTLLTIYTEIPALADASVAVAAVATVATAVASNVGEAAAKVAESVAQTAGVAGGGEL